MRNIARRFASGCHSDAAIRFLQGKDVINAVAGHRDSLLMLLQCFYQYSFLFGRDAPENIVFKDGIADFIIREPRQTDVSFGTLDSRSQRDFRNSDRVVTGNDFDVDAVLFEIFDCLDCIIADVVFKNDQANRRHAPRSFVGLDLAFGETQEQDAIALGCVAFDFSCDSIEA